MYLFSAFGFFNTKYKLHQRPSVVYVQGQVVHSFHKACILFRSVVFRTVFPNFFELSHAEEATVSEETTVKDLERSGKIGRLSLEANVPSSSNSGSTEKATSEKDALHPLFTFSWQDFRFFKFDKM